jgi:hypothetical protein
VLYCLLAMLTLTISASTSASISSSTSFSYRDLITANNFELQDKKRTKGKNPVLQVVVSALNAQTFTSAEESSDSFELQMLKPSSNLKNTNGRVCEHYKLQNLKILEVCPSLSLCVCLLTNMHNPYDDRSFAISSPSAYIHSFIFTAFSTAPTMALSSKTPGQWLTTTYGAAARCTWT